MADAVLGTGSILRNEPEVKWLPVFPDLIEYRQKYLKKSKFNKSFLFLFKFLIFILFLQRYPINVVLSGGNIDLKHPIFHDKDLQVIILTTSQGKEFILKSNVNIPSKVTIEEIEEDESGIS